MPDDSEKLVADLANLWLCGRSYLPSAAAYIADVNGVIAQAGDDRSTFARAGMASGTHYGAVFPHWDALRDELQRVLAVSAENMYATADALVEIANLYAEADGVSAELLEKIRGYTDSDDYVIDDPARRPEVERPD